MVAAVQSVRPIAKGYAYALRVRVSGEEPSFPLGCALKGEVRPQVGSADLSGTLTTDDGSIVRIDDHTVELRMPASLTAAIASSNALLDLVRIDVSPDVWLGIQMQLPVIKPITAPGPDA